jgi:hypothetical protein
MKPIKITEVNKAKIQAAIDEVQTARIKVRTITAHDVLHAIRVIEGRLIDLLNTCDWHGLSFYVDPNAQKFAKSYKGTPESTVFLVNRLTNSWQLEYVQRRPTEKREFIVYNMADKAYRLSEFAEENF